jgi:hypothetical protein
MKGEITRNKKPSLEDLNINTKKEVDPYIKKIKSYIFKIIVEIILIATFIGCIFLFKNISKKSNQDHIKNIADINNNISLLEQDIRNIEGKIAKIKLYKTKWDNSSIDLIGLDDISPDYLKNNMKSLSSKYKIYNLIINNQPQQQDDIKSLKLRTLYLSSIAGNISFSSMTDLNGINFISDIINRLSGFFIIKNMKINKKQDKYKDEDILKIKQDEYDQFIVDFNVDYIWYVIKKK